MKQILSLLALVPFASAFGTGVLYTGVGNSIYRLDTTTNIVTPWATATNLPVGIAIDMSGNVYVSNLGDHTIQRFSSNGANLGTFAASGMLNPYGIAFNLAGELLVANLNALGTIRRFDANGVDLGNFGTQILQNPQGIAVDNSGNVFVTYRTDTNGNGAVRKFDSSGVDLGVFASLPGAFGLAFTPSGDLMVGYGNGIRKYSPAGADLGNVWTGGQFMGIAVAPGGDYYSQWGSGVGHYTSIGSLIAGPLGAGSFPTFLALQGDAVPEPASAGLLIAGFALAWRLRSRR